jgi:hypothetical protein
MSSSVQHVQSTSIAYAWNTKSASNKNIHYEPEPMLCTNVSLGVRRIFSDACAYSKQEKAFAE